MRKSCFDLKKKKRKKDGLINLRDPQFATIFRAAREKFTFALGFDGPSAGCPNARIVCPVDRSLSSTIGVIKRKNRMSLGGLSNGELNGASISNSRILNMND